MYWKIAGIIVFFYFSHGGSCSIDRRGIIILFGLEGLAFHEMADVFDVSARAGKRMSTTWLESIAETEGPVIVCLVVIFGLFGRTLGPAVVCVVNVFAPR